MVRVNLKDMAGRKNIFYYFSFLGFLFRVYTRFALLSLQKRLAFRMSSVLYLLVILCSVAADLLFVDFLYKPFSSVAGWGRDEAFLLVGAWLMLEGMAWCFFMSSFWRFDEQIRSGAFDILLVQPIPTLFHAATKQVSLEEMGTFIIGLFLVCRFMVRNPEFLSFIHVFLFLGSLFFGLILYFCLLVMIKSLTFRLVNTWSLSVFSAHLVSLGRFPNDIFRYASLKTITTIIIPLAFLGTIPARFFLGERGFLTLFYEFFLVVVFVFISQLIWRRALKWYSSASG